MSFHRRYALRGFFGDSGSNKDTGSDEEVTLESLLPDNAGIYYKGKAESESEMESLVFESNAVGVLSE